MHEILLISWNHAKVYNICSSSPQTYQHSGQLPHPTLVITLQDDLTMDFSVCMLRMIHWISASQYCKLTLDSMPVQCVFLIQLAPSFTYLEPIVKEILLALDEEQLLHQQKTPIHQMTIH